MASWSGSADSAGEIQPILPSWRAPRCRLIRLMQLPLQGQAGQEVGSALKDKGHA